MTSGGTNVHPSLAGQQVAEKREYSARMGLSLLRQGTTKSRSQSYGEEE